MTMAIWDAWLNGRAMSQTGTGSSCWLGLCTCGSTDIYRTVTKVIIVLYDMFMIMLQMYYEFTDAKV